MESPTKLTTARETLDLLQTDGGHILVALGLLIFGLILLAHWNLAEGKELFAFSLGILGYAFKDAGKGDE